MINLHLLFGASKPRAFLIIDKPEVHRIIIDLRAKLLF